MKRLAIAAVGLALVVAMGGSTRGATQSPPPPAIVSQACSVAYPGSIAVTFSWPETPGALQTWLDLSLFDNGFASDTFVGVGPLTPETLWFEWDGLLPGRTHYIRVNTLTPTGWLASPTAAFTTGVCAKPTASGGSVSQSCSEWGYLHAAFSWISGGGDSQWLDLATDPEWISYDMWMAYGPFSPQTALHEMVILPGYTYWWRINTHSAAGWSPSPVWTFVAPASCAPGPAAPPPISVPPRHGWPPPYPIDRDRCAMALYDWAQSYYLSPSAELQIEMYCGESPEVYVKGSTFPLSADRCAIALYDWAESGFLSPASVDVDLFC